MLTAGEYACVKRHSHVHASVDMAPAGSVEHNLTYS